MIKIISFFILIGVLFTILTLNTSVTRMGSGFLIGDELHIFTYYNLVKEAIKIKIKFPNEDDIQADLVFHDSYNNLAILKLQEPPKIKRGPIRLSRGETGYKTQPVFTLGYPWTNTMQDRHILIEGSASNTSMLLELNMPIEPVHSGSPLFNFRNEVVGMLLFDAHAKLIFKEKKSRHIAIPALLLEKAMKVARIKIITHEFESLTRESFINQSKNNIVLVEAT
jgi:S1-C subfamily serine protease